MTENISIVENEDPDVVNLLNKTAKELHEKYNKQRKINNKFLNKKTPIQKVFSVFLDIFCVILFLVGFVVCFSIINTTINGYMPNFAGYSNLVVSSKSMVASGYDVGDIVIIHSVDTDTLNIDDQIAFYVYAPSYHKFDVANAENISNEKHKTKYSLTFKQLFGFQTEEIERASKNECKLVFHHIRAIYKDQNGERWFKTYGSSNDSDDSWWINEKYVVGIKDEGFVARAAIGLVEFASKPYGVIVLSIPVVVLVVSMILAFLKNIQIAKLELDCVEEKRKITDEICVKNNVGFQMSKKTKFKILAQATEENREEYIKLLWRNGNAPNSVKKYYLRKKLLISSNQDLLNLNRECEKMFKDGEKPTKIAKYYLTEKQRIEEKSLAISKRLKSIGKYKTIQS